MEKDGRWLLRSSQQHREAGAGDDLLMYSRVVPPRMMATKGEQDTPRISTFMCRYIAPRPYALKTRMDFLLKENITSLHQIFSVEKPLAGWTVMMGELVVFDPGCLRQGAVASRHFSRNV